MSSRSVVGWCVSAVVSGWSPAGESLVTPTLRNRRRDPRGVRRRRGAAPQAPPLNIAERKASSVLAADPTIRILIVEDHDVVTHGVATMLLT